ncbi:MAG: hypothetical protein H7Z40_21500, partial [Phycisphaerae bacterium]|nr:hypothetical protein [Gemmatimonadaceae bacterium]
MRTGQITVSYHRVGILPFVVALAVSLAGCAGKTPTNGSADNNVMHAQNRGPESQLITARTNPLLAGGTDYTSDPAPLVANGRLYILTGRDTAPAGVNDFMMPEWQMLETRDEPARGKWTHNPHVL